MELARMWNDVSGDCITSIFRVGNQSSKKPSSYLATYCTLVCCSADFYPEDGYKAILRNIGSHLDHTAPYPRRLQHLYFPLWEPQILHSPHALLSTTHHRLYNFLTCCRMYNAIYWKRTLSCDTSSSHFSDSALYGNITFCYLILRGPLPAVTMRGT
jgi:hypothetical protein